jgi:hypothetical protein
MSDTTDEEFSRTIERVDAIAASAVDVTDVTQGFASDQEPNDSLRAVYQALSYYERIGESGEDYFGPQIEFENGSFPPRLNEIPNEVVEIWEQLSLSVTDPIVSSRLHDLCFIKKSGAVGAHARLAIAAYLVLARRYPSEEPEHPRRLRVAIGAVKYVSRALDLARRTRQDDLATEALDTGLGLVKVAMSDDEAGPGLVFGMLRLLVRDRECPNEVDALLLKERDKFQGDYEGTMSTINVQLERYGLEEKDRVALRREQAQAMLDAAETAEPVRAIFLLRDAAELAKRFGNEDLYVDAVRRMQASRGTNLGLTPVTTALPDPGPDLERWKEHLAEVADWGTAFVDLLSSEPPSGDLEANRALVEWGKTETPVQSTLARAQLGRDGLPVGVTPGGDPESLLSAVEKRRLAMLAPFHVGLVRALLEHWPEVGKDESVEFFRGSVHVPESVARKIGEALKRYRNEDFEGIVYVLLPCVERLARELLILVGEPLYVPPMFDKNGTYVGLGAMMEPLERHGIDASWIRYFKIYLLSDGLNVRNDGLHGNLDNVRELDAVFVLEAVLYLAFMKPV